LSGVAFQLPCQIKPQQDLLYVFCAASGFPDQVIDADGVVYREVPAIDPMGFLDIHLIDRCFTRRLQRCFSMPWRPQLPAKQLMRGVLMRS
jgi:hypothetical protein